MIDSDFTLFFLFPIDDANCTDLIFRPPTCEQLIMAQSSQHNVFVREWILQERMFLQIKYGS